MTYYEELGVGPGASAEEIRRAYRHQIKVFHPDLQVDERTRAWAETRVRRLNEIVEVLADPEQRRAYDYEVRLRFQLRPALGHVPAAGSRKAVWIVAAGTACLAAVLWTAAPGEPPVSTGGGTLPPPPAIEIRRPRPPVPVRSTMAESSRPEPARLESRPVQRKITQTSDSGGTPPDLFGSTSPQRTAEVPPPPPSPPVAGTSSGAKAGAELKPPNPVTENTLEGTWLFLPSRTDLGENKLYPPKYIELRIQAEAGTLFGRYRSSYEVHDQALSPNVNFNFQGTSAGGRARAAWTGPGGARGSVELELLSPMNLRVNWKAEETGPGLDLVAGTAVLVKRLEN